MPKACNYFQDSEVYDGLLKHIVPDESTSKAKEESQDLVDFCNQLALLEDLKEEIELGCREEEDTSEAEFQAKSL